MGQDLTRNKLKKYLTKRIVVDPSSFKKEDLQEAVDLIRMGEVIAFPTETVYGLGADATNSAAIDKIYEAKNRPSDNPLIVHVADSRMLEKCVIDVPQTAYALIKEFWPGPLTLVLKRSGYISEKVTKGMETVAIRSPSHPIAQKLIELCQKPIAAPSANLSGRPSPTEATHVLEDLDGRIPLVIDGGKTTVGLESTVISMVTETPILLRPGGITKEQLLKVLPDLEVTRDETIQKLSPGTRYPHYAPNKELVLLIEFDNARQIDEVLKKESRPFLLLCANPSHRHTVQTVLLGNSLAEIQRNLFNNLRKIDHLPVEKAFVEEVDQTNEGLAIMNRLRKAASRTLKPAVK